MRNAKDVTVGSKWVLDDGFDYSVAHVGVIHCAEPCAIEVTSVEKVKTTATMRDGPVAYQVRLNSILVRWTKIEGPESLPSEGLGDAQDIAENARLVGWDTGETLPGGCFAPQCWFERKQDAEAYAAAQSVPYSIVERPEPTAKSEAWF
jgi:hypothetical protein